MSGTANSALTIAQRRRARRTAYWNGGLWALGNGLTSGMLIVCLALELGAPGFGLGIGLILSAPHFAGLLRLAAPALIGWVGNRKRFCIGMYLASALVLFGIPLAASPEYLPSPAASLLALVALWCGYHLLEYQGTVALWSWLADLVPLRIRGRFIGYRERWMTTGQAVSMLAAGLFTWGWHNQHPELPKWIGYAIPAAMGACFMVASSVPLTAIPSLAATRTESASATFRSMLAPLADRRFRRLILFGCWFSFFNGVTLTVQNIFPYRALGLTLFVMLALKTGMRAGQLAVSPWMGRLADRFGNKPVMLAALPLVAAGPLFYFLAGIWGWWWLIGAWILWIAYAGLNVCLPNLMLRLSPGESNTPYIATYFAVTGLFNAASTVLGGALFDRFADHPFVLGGAAPTFDFYQISFLFGWLTRTMGVLLLLLVIEKPGDRAAGR